MALVLKSFLLIPLLLAGCSTPLTKDHGIETGSAVSGSFFADPIQFANSSVKLRIRDTSGDEILNVSRLKSQILTSLNASGYTESDKDFGILIDVNTTRLSSVANANQNPNSGLGAIVGAILGLEAARDREGMSKTSGLLLGAITGTAIEKVIRLSGASDTYILVTKVSIGIRREENPKTNLIIGKSRYSEKQQKQQFKPFALNDSILVVGYGGGRGFSKEEILSKVESRVARIIGGII